MPLCDTLLPYLRILSPLPVAWKQPRALHQCLVLDMEQYKVVNPGTSSPEPMTLPFKQFEPQWNDNLPISKLPNEIFVQILSISEPHLPHWQVLSHPWKNTCATWAPLMFVCRHWYDIICSTPLFWNHINVCATLNWLHLSIQRSGSSPLTLYFFSPDSVATTLDTLPPTIANRILKLVISPSKWIDLSNPPANPHPLSLYRAMSRLEELVIHPQPFTSSGFHLPDGPLIGDAVVSVDSFPALSVLKLSRVRIPSFHQMATVFPRLRVLSLTECPFGTRVTFQELLAAFSNCTELQELKLIDTISRAVRLPTTPVLQHPIPFPTLHGLTLSDRKSFVSVFLACVYIPPTARIHLMGDLDEHDVDQPSSFISMLPPDTSHLCHLRDATVVNVGASTPDGVTIATSAAITGDLTMDFVSHSNQWSMGDHFLPRVLRSSVRILRNGTANSVHSLNITGILDDVTLEDWKVVFGALPRLKNLKTSSMGTTDVTDLFCSLHPELGLDGGGANVPPVPCPELAHLHLEGATWFDGFLDVIASCAAARAACGKGFKRLHLVFWHNARDPEVFRRRAEAYEKRIADAVGEGDLLFEEFIPGPEVPVVSW